MIQCEDTCSTKFVQVTGQWTHYCIGALILGIIFFGEIGLIVLTFNVLFLKIILWFIIYLLLYYYTIEIAKVILVRCVCHMLYVVDS